MPTITICSSASFYKYVVGLRDELQALGYEVIIPKTANSMAEKNDYEVSHYKTWFNDSDDYTIKADLMRGHFAEIAKGDAVLVVNNRKHGVDDYIGGNVLMEMAIGFHLNKSIFLLNDIPEGSSFEEEIRGLGSVPLRGNVYNLVNLLPLVEPSK
jgi:hypothetical protein